MAPADLFVFDSPIVFGVDVELADELEAEDDPEDVEHPFNPVGVIPGFPRGRIDDCTFDVVETMFPVVGLLKFPCTMLTLT